MAKKDKIDTLKKKQDQLQAQIQSLEAAEKTRERKRDTRRKILIGAYMLDKAREEGDEAELYRQMDSYLKRNSDRVLFGLKPLATAQKG